MKLIYKGKFTSGYYNEMEAGCPVFIDDEPLSDLVKEMLQSHNLDSDFCDSGSYPNEKPSDNPLIGESVTLTIEIEGVK
ncbi:MAG: hypothetical protein GY832_26270 [Chloroflexi bacterium]|nr:hypothetical protein [Chloroflexota bacterium]